MARRTFSLPDELDRKLEQYALAHNLPISQVAQQALEEFLSDAPAAPAPAATSTPTQVPPPPVQPDPHLAMNVHQLQDYVAGLASYVDSLRSYLAQNTQIWNQPPQPFPPPPWWQQ
jgi:hypothetical protein